MLKITATMAIFALVFSACCLGGEKASFTVATCNIQMAPTPSANKWEFRKDFQKELLDKYRFDIFGMQETFKHQIDYVLPDGYAYIGCGRDDGAQKGEYSPIAYDKSKFNCLESGVFWLSQTPSRPSFGWDAACRRLCTWGRFRHLKSGKIFYFFNTHLDHKGKLARAEGVKLILKRVGEIAKGGSFIITGDFNARPSDAEIAPMFDPKNAVEASAAELKSSLVEKLESWDYYERAISSYPESGSGKRMRRLYSLLIQAALFSDVGISTGDLEGELGISFATMKKLLTPIENAGLLRSQFVKREKYYWLDLDKADRLAGMR